MSDPVADAVAALRDGALVVFPTDTVYGIAAHPGRPGATDRLFAAKGRPRELELPVLAPDLASARTVADLDERAERLAARFWPGPLTIVAPRAEWYGFDPMHVRFSQRLVAWREILGRWSNHSLAEAAYSKTR